FLDSSSNVTYTLSLHDALPISYTIDDLHFNLSLYAGKDFADNYFNNYIYKGGMPDFKTLFESVGISMERQEDKPYIGIRLRQNQDRKSTRLNSSHVKISYAVFC